jgi:hypothetical protein
MPIRYGLRSDTRPLLRALARRSVRSTGRVHLFRPLALPPRSHPRARALSEPFERRQVSRAVAAFGLERPVAVWAHATQPLHGAAGELLSVSLVKDWIEAGAELVGRDSKEIAAGRRAMWERADLICATSTELARSLSALGYDATVLKHGFHAELASRYDAPAPAEYEGLSRPLLGYAGRIDGRLDFQVLRELAERFARGSLLLIGPTSPRVPRIELARLAALPNVHLLGTRARDQLPAYLRHLDCCLLPYAPGEWARHGSPLKLWDYLYAGPPIVGSGYLALREYPPPLVNFVSGARPFAAAVEAALTAGDGRERRHAFALANSWEARAGQFQQLVDHRLRRPPRKAWPLVA